MKRLFKRIWRGKKGITGLETAIILIAFVVVASVFAYTVLSAGLFSTQKSQEAVYGGLEEAQSTIELKGVVVTAGVSELNDFDYPKAWQEPTASAGNLTLTRETSDKMEGSASLKGVIAAGAALNDTLIYHAMDATDLTNGDTLSFWMKADANCSGNLTFYLATDTDLVANQTDSYTITPSGTGWEKHSFDLTGGDDDSSDYYGIALAGGSDTTGTFYLDNVRFDDVASMDSEEVALDTCDYPLGWVADTNATLVRDTVTKMEGTASANITVGASMSVNEEVMYHAMKAKDWSDGDTITFWIKEEAALIGNLTFHLATGADLSGTSTESYVITNAGTGWEKHTVTLSGGNDDLSDYYGISLSTDSQGVFYFDICETEANLSDNNDPMLAYAHQVVVTVGNALGGEPVDFTTTSDADSDGILSDETTKSHKVVVSYSDAYTQVTDLAWAVSSVGKDDSDSLLETNEKFQLTIDLGYVNNNAGLLDQKKKVASNHNFTIEIKPHKGAVLTVERTMPIRVRDVNNLD
jgi:flagellin-like protein